MSRRNYDEEDFALQLDLQNRRTYVGAKTL